MPNLLSLRLLLDTTKRIGLQESNTGGESDEHVDHMCLLVSVKTRL